MDSSLAGWCIKANGLKLLENMTPRVSINGSRAKLASAAACRGWKKRDAPVQVIYNIDVVMRCPDEFREV
jgi:hypothetical protein